MKPALLMVGNFLSDSTGGRGVCEDLAAGLSSRGWSIFTTSRRKRRMARLADMLATVVSRRHSYTVAQVDVYSGPAFRWAEIVVASLRILRCPVVLTLHGGNLPRFAEEHPHRVQHLLDSAVAVTSPSPYLKEELKAHRSGIRVIPNGLDLRLYAGSERAVALPKLVWLRALHRMYNPVLAVNVTSRLSEEFPEIALRMIGPDKGDGSRQELETQIRKLGLTGTVRVCGAVKKTSVPEAMQWGDIFLNTTNVDNTPVSIVEAMACGLCVVTTDVGGLPYLVENGEDGLLVPPDDPEAMTAAVRRILMDPVLAHRLSLGARRKAESFDWGNILPRWERLLGAAAQPKRARERGRGQ